VSTLAVELDFAQVAQMYPSRCASADGSYNRSTLLNSPSLDASREPPPLP
jgi:hypothetical protein